MDIVEIALKYLGVPALSAWLLSWSIKWYMKKDSDGYLVGTILLLFGLGTGSVFFINLFSAFVAAF